MAANGSVVARVKVGVERARARYGFVDAAVRVFKRFGEDDGGVYAASLTYYMFFSIFPMLLVAIAVLGYLTFVSDALRERILQAGLGSFPMLNSVIDESTLASIRDRAGTIATVGVVLALYSGSGGIVALGHALNRIDRVEQERNFVGKRLASLKLLALLSVLVLISVGLGSVAQFAGSFAAVVAFIVGVGVNIAIFVAAFTFLPNVDRPWTDVIPGAVVAGIAFEILKFLGGIYLQTGAQGRNATFGAFTAAAGLLVVAYLLAQITLLTAEINAVLAERRATRGTSDYGGGEEAT